MSGAPLRIRALQAVMLRLTVDPVWGERVYAGDAKARVISTSDGPYTLTAEDLFLLREVDRRAWTTDRYRRTRFVQALIQEYAVTTAIVGVPSVDRFFGTEAFATVLGHRGSMAEAFGEWARTNQSTSTTAIISLELAVARARRDHRPTGPGYVTRPGVEGVLVPTGTLAAWQDGLAALGGNPVEAAARGLRWSPPPLKGHGEPLLIERNDRNGLGVHVVSSSTVGLLRFCQSPRTRAAIGHQAKRLRIPRKKVGTLLRELVEDGSILYREG